MSAKTKSSQIKVSNLIPIRSVERLLQLADEKKSVWWTDRKILWSAAFFQNWNARLLDGWIRSGYIMEVK